MWLVYNFAVIGLTGRGSFFARSRSSRRRIFPAALNTKMGGQNCRTLADMNASANLFGITSITTTPAESGITIEISLVVQQTWVYTDLHAAACDELPAI